MISQDGHPSCRRSSGRLWFATHVPSAGASASPHQLFTGSPPPWRIQDFRVFGCPVFVLDKRLQDGDTLPKWRARCWTGVYIGYSLQHAGNVPLVYNPATTHVSPQYHVTFDDGFTTVRGVTAVLSDEAYAKLYDSTAWLYRHAYGDTDDVHLFADFWSVPPASHSRPCSKIRFSRNAHCTSCPTDIVSAPVVSLSAALDTSTAAPADCCLSPSVHLSLHTCLDAASASCDIDLAAVSDVSHNVTGNHAMLSGNNAFLIGKPATTATSSTDFTGNQATDFGKQEFDHASIDS
jgi:hypothetical protein